MTRRAFCILLLCATLAACERPSGEPQRGAAPETRATVVTIATTVQPGNRRHEHTLVIGERGLARSLDEVDEWRLLDTRARRITRVDDIARTIRTETLDTILGARRAALAETLPPHYPQAAVRRTAERRTILGIPAAQVLITTGDYQRELWIGKHRAIPDGLFAMMHASEPLSTPLAPMMRAVDEALLQLEGFPLEDHTRVPMGESIVSIDRVVLRIETKIVPQRLLEVPSGYRDLTAK